MIRKALLACIVSVLLQGTSAADNWVVADLDSARVGAGMSSGPLAQSELAMFFASVQFVEWGSVVPYVALLRAPWAFVDGYGFGATLRLNTPFGERGYRVFFDSSFGAIDAGDSSGLDDVETGLRGHAMLLAGPEFQIWSRLTISTSIGWSAVLGETDAVYPRRLNFTAQTAFRWYL